MKPSVGRIVLYTNLGDRDGRFPPEAQAALITKVKPLTEVLAAADEENCFLVSLRIFYEQGEFTMIGVPYTAEMPASEGARGKWTWPPRV